MTGDAQKYDLSGDMDVLMFVSNAAPGILRARGQVRSLGCHVTVTYHEKELFGFGRVSDSASIRINDFYRSDPEAEAIVAGPCGDFNGAIDVEPLADGFELKTGKEVKRVIEITLC